MPLFEVYAIYYSWNIFYLPFAILIYPWETYQGPFSLSNHILQNVEIFGLISVIFVLGFRAIGCGIVLSSVVAVFINLGLSGKTCPVS